LQHRLAIIGQCGLRRRPAIEQRAVLEHRGCDRSAVSEAAPVEIGNQRRGVLDNK
jgi:hypothetical protein